jgi:hypothetical protein
MGGDQDGKKTAKARPPAWSLLLEDPAKKHGIWYPIKLKINLKKYVIFAVFCKVTKGWTLRRWPLPLFPSNAV